MALTKELRRLLVDHSRSFSISLLALPHQQRAAIAITYLVARVADTVADAGTWSKDIRLHYLQRWEKAVFGEPEKWWVEDSVGSFLKKEAYLIMAGREIAEEFLKLEKTHAHHSRELLKQLFQAMRWQVDTFGAGSEAEPIYGIPDLKMLDWYCYMHAGCVGPYWSRMFNLPEHLEILAIEYGKGLELINILRDVVDDRKEGRILLPKSQLEKFEFKTTEPWKEPSWQDFVESLMPTLLSQLEKAAHFCDSIPYKQMRLRWASMMPLKLAFASAQLYKHESSKEKTSKVSREMVQKLASESFWDALLNRSLSKRLLKG